MDQDDITDSTGADLVLFHLAQHPTATDQELATLLGKSLRTVRHLLTDLVDSGLLVRQPAGQQGRYAVAPHLPRPGKLQRLLALLEEGTANEELQITGTGGVKWLFQYLWDHGSDAMSIVDPHGIVLAVNRAYLDIWGYDAEEVVGRHFTILTAPNEREEARERYQQAFMGESLAPFFERAIRRKDGTLGKMRTQAAFLTENYTRIAMLCIVQDITPPAAP